MLKNECIYCELLLYNRPDQLNALLDPAQRRYTQLMGNSIFVLRTEYAHSLLAQWNVQGAYAVRQKFDRRAQKHPYPCEVEGELELLYHADRKYQELVRQYSSWTAPPQNR